MYQAQEFVRDGKKQGYSMEQLFIERIQRYKEKLREEPADFDKLASSSFFHDYLERIMRTMTAGIADDLKLELLSGMADHRVEVSRVDGKVLYINTDSRMIRGFKANQNKMYGVLGCMFHEIAHVRYLDIKGEKRALAELWAGRLPYAEGIQEQMGQIQRLLGKEENRNVFVRLYQGLSDVISDAHDEKSLCREYGVLIRQSIRTMQEYQFSTVVSLEEMLKDEAYETFGILLTLILQYARFGTVFVLRQETIEDTFYLKFLEAAREYIDRAVSADRVKDKFLALHEIIRLLVPYLQILLISEEEQQESDADSGKKSGNTQDGQEQCEEKCQDCGSKHKDKSGEEEEEEADDAGGESNCGEDGVPSESDPVMKQMQMAFGGSGGDSISAPPASILRSGKIQQPMQTGAGKKEELPIPFMEEEAGRIVEIALQEMQEDMRKEEALELAAMEQHSEAMARIHTGNVSSVHFGIQVDLKKAEAAPDDKNRYERIAESHRAFINKTKKEIRRIIQDQDVALQKHRYMGRRIDAKSAYKVDQRFFTKKRNPEKTLDMAIAILVDNSGSMEGERIESAKEAAILLTEVLNQLEIPCLVASHSSEGAMNFTIYQDFDDTGKAKYSICRMMPGGDNRDGLALDIAGKMLIKREEKDRLLIIISDGQPNSHGYAGSMAKKDIKEVVAGFRRQQIKTLAFAIGDDKKQVKDIYGEAFIDISDYEKFPKMLAKLIEREIMSNII